MPTPAKVGCAVRAAAPEIKEAAPALNAENNKEIIKEEMQMITVGKKAPDFTAKAFYKGEFVDVSLSEYEGQWRVLCFYPGDFTFV